MTKAAEEKAPAKVKIKLERDHTHQRQAYKKGAVIEVLPHTAETLVSRNIGSRA